MEMQLPLPQRGTAPQFLAHVCCGQMAGWIKMPLGTELGLGPGDTVLDGGPSSPQRGTDPDFWPMSVIAKWLVNKDATWYGDRPSPRPHCVRSGPSSSLKKGHRPPIFG